MADPVRDKRVAAFLTLLKERIADAHVVGLVANSSHGDDLTIKFDNGFELNIEISADNPNEACRLVVNGDGKKVPLDTGELDDDN